MWSLHFTTTAPTSEAFDASLLAEYRLVALDGDRGQYPLCRPDDTPPWVPR